MKQDKKFSKDFFLRSFETVGVYIRGLYKRIWLIKLVYRVKKRRTFFGNAKKAVENFEKKTSLEFLYHLTQEDI